MTEQDKKIKELLKGNFEEPLPSSDFTENIMINIVEHDMLEKQKEFEYVHVISKMGWVLISVLFLALVFIGLTSDKGSKFSVSDYIQVWQFDSSIIHSQFTLFSVLSILTVLILDHLFKRTRLG